MPRRSWNRNQWTLIAAYRERAAARPVRGLYFCRDQLEKVLRGEKTMTLRSYRVKPGVYELRSNRHRPEPSGRLVQVLWVSLVHVDWLSRRVARLEGFQGREELRAYLERRYPGRTWFWLHEFRLLPMGALEAQEVKV